MRAPHTTGLAEAFPGISTFQATFLVSLHSMGGLPCGAMPFIRGPRHCGQNRSAPAAGCATLAVTRRSGGAASARKTKPVARTAAVFSMMLVLMLHDCEILFSSNILMP